MSDFVLSASLVGHEADVRAVAFANGDTILSASRDCSVRIWRREQPGTSGFSGTVLSRGSEYVNSVAFCPPTKEHADGLAVSGGKDAIIEVKSPLQASSDNAERLLVGHANNVSALDISPNGRFLISGGWDGQARVWSLDSWDTTFMLEGHKGMAVWSVLALDENTIITGCADKNIRIFDLRSSSAGQVEPRSTIYTPDVVRSLCKIPPGHPSGADIASASNDGILRLWKLDGRQIGELRGHESFVYSITSLPSGELVSSGEDRTVRVWKGDQCVQTITHPAISVWSVTASPDTGDIVSGASDGTARVFTRRPEMFADQTTITEFEESVKQSSIPQQQVGGINKEKLPGPNFLTTKSGTKEGQVQMILEDNGSITAHQWSMSQQQWINVGTVVDAVGSTGKKVEYNGQSYDYVFDVDIAEGQPPLKLPYNLSENPYERASKFLSDNELPLSYLDSVANFITENTKGATLGDTSTAGGPDPMGSESRYKPGQSSAPSLLPQQDYLDITAVKFDALFNKITNVNKTMVAAGRKEDALNPGEELALASLREALENDKAIPLKSVDLVVRIITQWPYADRLAGLDLQRCLVRYGSVAGYSDSRHGSMLDLAIKSAMPADGLPGEHAVMMAARTVANLFMSANGRNVVASQADTAITFMERVGGVGGGEAVGKTNRNLHISFTTAAVNFAVLVDKEKLLSAAQRRRLVVVLGATLQVQSDSEVVYRALVALGTLLPYVKADVGGLDIASWMSRAVSQSSEDRIKLVVEECRRATR